MKRLIVRLEELITLTQEGYCVYDDMMHKDRVVRLFKELLSTAKEEQEAYNSPETQELIELGRYVKTYFEQPYERHSIAVEGAGWGQVIAWSLDEFIKWGRDQEGKVE